MSKDSVYFTVGDELDRHDVKRIKHEIAAIPGILSVTVGGRGSRVAVDFDSTGSGTGAIEKRLREMGYQIVGQKLERHIM
jgi:copper chaperone CopZ